MKNLFTIGALLFAFGASAQLVHRKAPLTKDGGALEIRDSVRVSAYDNGLNTFEVHLHGWVHNEFINELDKRMMADAVIFGEKGDTLATVSESYPVDSLWPSAARRKSKYYEVSFSGTLATKYLERRTFPTYALEQFYSEKQTGSQAERLAQFFGANGWEESNEGEYQIWAFLDRQQNPSQPSYIALFILRGSMPYCLVNHGEAMDYSKIKQVEDREYGTYHFFQRPNDRFLKEIDDLVLNYIQL
jgi:hypothetical protein